MQVELKTVAPPKLQRGFEMTRRKLVEMLAQFTFMRVTVVTFPECALRTGRHFQGEAVEVFPGKHSHSQPRTAFFSRFARGNGLSFFGVCQLVDCPISLDHPSAIPQVGDILVGACLKTAKGKLPYELRGWSNNAKPLLELARIAQFGTRMSEKELATLLKQPGCSLAKIFLRLNENKPLDPANAFEQRQRLQTARNNVLATDDFWALARIVCFAKLEEDATLQISVPFNDMVETIAMKTGDEALLEAWSALHPPQQFEHTSTTPPMSSNGYVQQVAHTEPSRAQALLSRIDPATVMSNLKAAAASQSQIIQTTSPQFAWQKMATFQTAHEEHSTSPVYAPTSPAYAPHSPPAPADSTTQQPSSPAYTPHSPPYQPTSPAYTPHSPPYQPSSPPAQSQMEMEK